MAGETDIDIARSPGRVSVPARRDSAGGVAVTATGAETRSARLKGFTLGEVQKMGQIAAEAGMFGGRKKEDQVTPSQAVMKILAGLEIDIPITQALAMIDIIDGQPAYRAKLMAAVIKRSGKYRFRVVEWTDERCEIEWFELVPGGGGVSWESPGPNTKFDIEDARKADLLSKTGSNYKRYPKAMLWARALSQGAGAYCMDVMAAGYTSEELYEQPRDPETYDEYVEKVETGRTFTHGDAVDDGDVVDVEPIEDAPARDRTPDSDDPATGSGPPPDPSPVRELYEIIGAGRVDEDDQVGAAQVRQLRNLAKPFDAEDLSRVVRWATRGDGARATATPANLTTQRFGELRHFFENEQTGDRGKLVKAVQAWEAEHGSDGPSDPVSTEPVAASTDSPSGDAAPADSDDAQGRLA